MFFGNFVLAEGLSPIGFIETLFSNGASGGFTADLLIGSTVFWSYMLSKKEPKLWLFILLNLSIGLSRALPAYLYAETGAETAARPKCS